MTVNHCPWRGRINIIVGPRCCAFVVQLKNLARQDLNVVPSVDVYVQCVKLAKGASVSHIPFCERYWYFLSMMDIESFTRLSDEAATLASAASAIVKGTGEQEPKDAAAQIDHVCSPNRLELEKRSCCSRSA
jgi:hypothetical protein